MGKSIDFIFRLKMIGHQKTAIPAEIVRNEMLTGYLHPGLHRILRKSGIKKKERKGE